MRTRGMLISIMTMVVVFLGLAGNVQAGPICDNGPCISFLRTVIDNTTQRITEVQVNNVESITGTYLAPDPFTAPLLTDPMTAQTLAFNALGVPLNAANLLTSFDDISNIVLSPSSFNFSEEPGSIFIGGLGALTDAFSSVFDQLVPNMVTEFEPFAFQANFGFSVITGQVQLTLTTTNTIVDAFRMNISQDPNSGGGPGPGGNPIPEPSTMLLFGSGLAGLIGWRLRKSKTA